MRSPLQAYRVGLYGRKIVWVFVGWFSTNFWKIPSRDIDCTEAEMSLAVEGSFITGPVYQNPIEERGIANITGLQHNSFDVQMCALLFLKFCLILREFRI